MDRTDSPNIADVPLQRILAAVRSLVGGRERIELVDDGIDLLFDDGVVARCRACDVAWRVSRGHFRHRAWWSCPGGCRPLTPGCASAG